MPRSGYIADLRAQVGNRLLTVPSVTAAIFDQQDRLPILEHVDDGLWAPPGGTIEPGETPADAMVRELREELRLAATPMAIIGVFGGPDFAVTYDNGDVTTYVMTVFECSVEDVSVDLDEAEVTAHAFVDEPTATRVHAAPWVAAVVPEIFAWRSSAQTAARYEPPTWRPTKGRERSPDEVT